MATRLARFLEEIDPARTIDVVERRIDEALAHYHRQRNIVSSWEDIESCLAEMVRLGRNAALNLRTETTQSIEVDFRMAIQYLERKYPHDTYRIVYDIMSSGAEGGVLAISRTLARLIADAYSQNEINAKAQAFWDSRSVEEKLAGVRGGQVPRRSSGNSWSSNERSRVRCCT